MKLPNYLETKRLILRPCFLKDYPNYLKFMQNEEATRYLAFSPEQKTEVGAKQLFEFVLNSYQSDNPMFVLAICLKESDRYIGSCGLNPLNDNEAECYYTLLAKYWQQGYGSEATFSLLNYAFQKLKLNKIIACVSENNPASWHVAEKVGMYYEKDIEANPEEFRDRGKQYAIDSEIFTKIEKSNF
jgi:ribosomal-protein-alanine N-acetyltransferase